MRSKISELAATVAQCKVAVAEYLTTKSTLPATIAASGCTTTPTRYGTGIDVVNGLITVAATTEVGGNPDQAGNVYGLRPELVAGTDAITAWDCTRATGGTTIDSQYLPAVCRN